MPLRVLLNDRVVEMDGRNRTLLKPGGCGTRLLLNVWVCVEDGEKDAGKMPALRICVGRLVSGGGRGYNGRTLSELVPER